MMHVEAFSFEEHRRLEVDLCRSARESLASGSVQHVIFEARETVRQADGTELAVTGIPCVMTRVLVSASWTGADTVLVDATIAGGGASLLHVEVPMVALRRGVLPVDAERQAVGVRECVRWLRSNGFCTADAEGGETGGYPHVAVVFDDPADLVAGALEVVRLLRCRGVEVVSCGTPGGVFVDGFYDPAAEVASLDIIGLDDALLADPSTLRLVDARVEIGGDLWVVAGRFRPEPPRFDVHGALRVRDGQTVESEEFVQIVQAHDAARVVHDAALAVWSR